MGWRDIVAEKTGAAPAIDEPQAQTESAGIPSRGMWRERVKEKQGLVPAAEVPMTPFPDDRAETQAAKTMPELGQVISAGDIEPAGLLAGSDRLKVASLAPVLLTSTKPEETADILSKNFPEIGITYDPGGNIIATNNETGVQNILNRPGISQRDVLQTMGLIAAFFPSGKAAGVLPQAATLKQKMAAGGAASAATQAGIEGVQSMAGGGVDGGEIALAGGLGGVGETIGPAIKAFKDARAAKGLEVAKKELQGTLSKMKIGEDAANKVKELTGVDVGLFKAQKTMQPSTLLKQRFLPQLDASAQKAAGALEKQNKEIYDATAEMINTIAPADSVSTGAKRFKTAAQAAIEAAEQRRSAVTKGVYKEAIKKGADVDLTPVIDLVESSGIRGQFGGSLKTSMDKVSKLLGLGKGGSKINLVTQSRVSTGKPNLSQLQNAKFEIDNMLEDARPGAMHKTVRMKLEAIQNSLVKSMEDASPAYKEANDKFREMSPAVDEIRNRLGAIAAVGDDKLKLISGKIFDAAEANPKTINEARRLIEAADPGAWNELLRVEMQKRIGGLTQLTDDMPGEMVGNVPAQLRRAMFGNPEKRRVMLSAMGAEQRRNFVHLEELMRRAASGRAAGSPTAAFGDIKDKLKGGAVVIRDMIFRPLETLQRSGEGAIFDRNASHLADTLFDPSWQPKLKQLRNASGKKSESIMKEIFAGAKASAQAERMQDEQ
jgi:hypothetical protein